MGREKQLSALDKLIYQTIADEKTLGREDDPAREQLPVLWELLSRTDAGKEHVMRPGRLSLSLCPAGVTVTLVLADLGYTIGCVVPHLADVLTALEGVVSGPNPPWQQLARQTGGVRKKKAKP